MPRPRHRAHHHAVLATAHPRRVRLDERQRRPEIQRPPAPPALAEIEPRTAAPTDPTAIALMPARPDLHHHLLLIAEAHRFHDRGAQPEQPRPYPSDAHVATAPFASDLRTAGNLGARRRAPQLSRSPHPRQQHKRPFSLPWRSTLTVPLRWLAGGYQDLSESACSSVCWPSSSSGPCVRLAVHSSWTRIHPALSVMSGQSLSHLPTPTLRRYRRWSSSAYTPALVF